MSPGVSTGFTAMSGQGPHNKNASNSFPGPKKLDYKPSKLYLLAMSEALTQTQDWRTLPRKGAQTTIKQAIQIQDKLHSLVMDTENAKLTDVAQCARAWDCIVLRIRKLRGKSDPAPHKTEPAVKASTKRGIKASMITVMPRPVQLEPAPAQSLPAPVQD